MENKIVFLYGMSGTFKRTMIEDLLKEQGSNSEFVVPMWSMIKLWKKLESTIFSEKVEKNDLNFANLHLCNLENTLNLYEGKDKFFLVERGVSDMLFFYQKKLGVKLDDNWVKDVIDLETSICSKYNKEMKKFLYIQEDRDFIQNVLFKESTRKDRFVDVDDYLKTQNDYVEFTIKYNNISDNQIQRILSARSFLEQELGIKYKEC